MTTPNIILPQLIVEAGLVNTSPVQAGTVLILDDPVLGKLDTGTLGADETWTDLSSGYPQRVLGFTISRPSTRLQGPLWNYQAATASILCDDSDGALDPDNLAGPYVSAGATQIVPMVPVRVRALFGDAVYPLYSGFADGWVPAQVTYQAGYAAVTIPCTDGFKILAGTVLAAGGTLGTGETSGARVNRILTLAGWYTGRRRISTGNSTVQGTTLGADSLSLMQIAADSEIGQLYSDGAGTVTYRARHDLLTDTRSNTVQAVFGDLPGTSHSAGTELPYAAVGRMTDDSTVANDVQATRLGGALQEATAPAGNLRFTRSYARSDLILQTDPDALSWAQWVLGISKTAENRIESLTIDPQADPLNLWPQCLGREIGDRIQVWHRPASVAAFSRDCFITGITHAWDSGTAMWQTTWTLQDATRYGSWLTLDQPVLGQLDNNMLAW